LKDFFLQDLNSYCTDTILEEMMEMKIDNHCHNRPGTQSGENSGNPPRLESDSFGAVVPAVSVLNAPSDIAEEEADSEADRIHPVIVIQKGAHGILNRTSLCLSSGDLVEE
jgi:hypothetical protein